MNTPGRTQTVIKFWTIENTGAEGARDNYFTRIELTSKQQGIRVPNYTFQPFYCVYWHLAWNIRLEFSEHLGVNTKESIWTVYIFQNLLDWQTSKFILGKKIIFQIRRYDKEKYRKSKVTPFLTAKVVNCTNAEKRFCFPPFYMQISNRFYRDKLVFVKLHLHS